jgi:diketogulonate reductase-like aldo/keto reductase
MVTAEDFALGYGTYRLRGEGAAQNVRVALETGYRHVDTAQMYNNEEAVGAGIADADVPREEVFLATKVHPENLAHEDVIESTEESLGRLGTDYVDLLYVHWPHTAYEAEDTLSAFDELVDRGAVRAIGLSNFTPPLLDEARDALDHEVFAHQVECHLNLPQSELRDYAVWDDHWLVAYSPLARGAVLESEAIRDVATTHDATPAQVALAWVLAQEHTAAIPKASGDHVRENFGARDLELTADEMAHIEAGGEVGRERVIDPESAPWNA